MKCIILCAGYATRMYPLTKNKAKALLKINDNCVLDLIWNNVKQSTDLIEDMILISNNLFYQDFLKWKDKQKNSNKIKIINDGTNSVEESLGAVSDLMLALNQEKIDDDVLIMAGDNILDFSLDYVFDQFANSSSSYILYYEESNIEKLRKTGVVQIDENTKVINMEEKPQNPKSNYAVPPFYFIKKKDLNLILKTFANKKVDSMGEIIVNLINTTTIKAIKMKGKRMDIGSIETYKKILNEYVK